MNLQNDVTLFLNTKAPETGARAASPTGPIPTLFGNGKERTELIVSVRRCLIFFEFLFRILNGWIIFYFKVHKKGPEIVFEVEKVQDKEMNLTI